MCANKNTEDKYHIKTNMKKNKTIILKISSETFENQIKARANEMSETISQYIRRLCSEDFQKNKKILFQTRELDSSNPNFQAEVLKQLNLIKQKLE